jgi:hypothetical protein
MQILLLSKIATNIHTLLGVIVGKQMGQEKKNWKTNNPCTDTKSVVPSQSLFDVTNEGKASKQTKRVHILKFLLVRFKTKIVGGSL